MIAGLLSAFMSTFAGTVNAATAYLVNDVYKRYWKPNADDGQYIRVSRLASFLVVVVGCGAGFFTPSVHSATEWIVAALWGGYAAPNLLKWHWWRMNGHGYFWGMMSGLSGALILLWFPEIEPLHAFPILLLVSTAGSVFGSLLTAPQDVEELKDFYENTRPWGFWKPIERAVCQSNPDFVPNDSCLRDCSNVLIGVVWQTAFIAVPVYVVIQNWQNAAISSSIVVFTSIVLKFSWYDHLESDA